MVGFGAGDSTYVQYQGVPTLVEGCAIFFYAEMTTIGTLPKRLCGVEDGGSQDHIILLVDVGAGVVKAQAQVTEDTGGGTSRLATGTTTIVNGSKHLYGLVHDGTNLKVYVDPSDGLPEATTACGPAREASAPPRVLVVGAARRPTSIFGGPDVSSFGDIALYVGADAANLTADDIAALYAIFKAVYPALP